jgi:hypothetical protein
MHNEMVKKDPPRFYLLNLVLHCYGPAMMDLWTIAVYFASVTLLVGFSLKLLGTQ